MLSVPIFLPEQGNDLPKAGISLSGGDWGEGSPHSSLFCCYLVSHNPARCIRHHFTPLPSHALGPFTPLSLQQRDGFGLPDKGEQARVISGQTAPWLLPGQGSVPHPYPHTPRATEQELVPPSLGLQEGKRQILLARLSNLLIVFIYIYLHLY